MLRLLVLVPLCLAGAAAAQPDPALRIEALPGARAADALDALPAVRTRGGTEADLYWEWTGEPRWMTGLDFGLETFFGSLGRARYVVGSTVGPGGDAPVDIVFSSAETTLGPTWRRDGGEFEVPYSYGGVGAFPGAAYDVSDPSAPRRLNVGFVEDDNLGAANLQWDPTDAANGKREYLVVFASTYDGTGETYAGSNLFLDGPGLDLLYFWRPRLRPGYAFLQSDPATLGVRLAEIAGFTATPGNGEVTLSWEYDAPPEAAAIRLYGGTTSPASDLIAAVAPTATSYFVDGLDEDADYVFRAEAVDADGAVVGVSLEARARPLVSRNVTLLGQLDPRGDYGDVWGYTDPDTGTEYALLTSRDQGLSVIELGGSEPVEVAFVPGLQGSPPDGPVADAKDVKTYAPYAYVVHEYAPVQIIDLSDPASPEVVGTLDTQPGVEDGGAHNALVYGDYLHVVGGRFAGGAGLRTYSLADPEAPAFVAEYHPPETYNQQYYHDLYVDGDRLYAAAIYGDGVDVLDVSDPADPQFITNFNYPGSGAHNVCGTEGGGYVFVGDEIGTGPYTRVFDVADLSDIDLVAEIEIEPGQPVHNCYVEGDLLYIAHYALGVRVFDVADPEAPEEVALYDTYLGPGGGFEGTWTAYPFPDSDTVIASDRSTGLYVLRLDGGVLDAEPAAPSAAGLTLEGNFPNPFAGATTVRYTLTRPAAVRLSVVDVLGREVAVLAEGPHAEGPFAVRFDGSNLPAGTYFLRLRSGGTQQVRPLLLLH